MFLSSRQRNPRRGVILLVVLALITLFASIGVAFVYFAEQEATKAQDQKAGETVKLPDADLLFNDILRQLVYPTTNNASALYTQSLLENMYGRTNTNAVPNVTAFNGTGRLPAQIIDITTGLYTGQDQLYKFNYQGRTYNETSDGSLNPAYTYPDHKNLYLGGVAANFREVNYPTHLPSVTEHGPVAIARSWAREMKFRIAIQNTASGLTVGTYEVVLNPYSNLVFPLTGVRHQDFWKNLPYLDMGALPALAPGLQYVPNISIQCTTAGANAHLMVNAAGMANHTLRPKPNNTTGFNAGFPPPGDNGGDVKCLPPEVKTLVGFNTTNNPVFANNDSYWMDVGFPALQWSNNRKIKPLVAMFIMDNDGKVNLNTAGNVRGQDTAGGVTYPTSGHGMGPYEINPTKLGLQFATNATYTSSPVTPLTVQSDFGALMGGRYDATTIPAYLRGRAGLTSALNGDPTTATSTYPSTAVSTYFPILRSAPAYSPYNLDGTYDGLSAAAWYKPSQAWQLAGDILPATTADPLFRRFPYFTAPVVLNNGFVAGNSIEYQRGGFNKSPLFLSPFASTQPTNNLDSAGASGSQRLFGLQNHAELYLTRDSGADKFNGELRKLSPSSYLTAQQRWQQTLISNDMNNVGIAPWFYNAVGDFNVPAAFTFPAPATQLTYGGSGNSQVMPTTSTPPLGEFSTTAGYSWRSLFGGASRLDLSRQLPDYPLPANNNTQLNFANPLVQAQYMIALQARQRLAREIYNSLNALMHPKDDAGYRYIGQLAVNIVDFIDNDDIPTWFEVPDVVATGAAKIVWGTELPRLLINEVYVEAVNHVGDPLMPMNQAQDDYDVQHWVELYNPLTSSNYPGAWATSAGIAPNNLDSEARLNVGGTSAYRLIIPKNSTSANTATMRAAANTLGYPNNLNDAQTKVIKFAANETVLPSDNNYGNGQTTTNNGFYLVGPGTAGAPIPPDGATTGAPTPPTDPLNFPTPQLSSPNMVQSKRITKVDGRFTDSNDNRSAILLQRLANPYLPHNPINDPTVIATGDIPDATLPYNPYITIDYVSNLKIQHAVHRTKSGSTTDNDPVDQRHSYGKLQPYASMNDNDNTPTTANVYGVWVDQNPDRHNGTAGVQALTNQPQHTFLRHNGVETDRPSGVTPVPTVDTKNPPAAAALTNNNTLRLPFDWLVHLDRNPTSPVDLLHVSGFKPHELTQQFNRLQSNTATVPTAVADTIHWTRVTPAAPATDVAAGNTIRISSDAGLIGQHQGVPYTLRNYDPVNYPGRGDLVMLRYDSPSGTVYDCVMARNVLHQTNPSAATPSTFDAISNVAVTGITKVTISLIVPFAHYAPWYRALQNVDVNSSSRLYRFLETVAVRNPGVDVGQYRFTSAVPTTTAGANTANISAPLDPTPGVDNLSRWIQLDHGTTAIGGAGLPNVTATRMISTNDALLNIIGADSVYGVTGALNGYNQTTAFNRPNKITDPTYAVGDVVVINAGVTAGNVVEQRATILAVDRANNRIRVVLSVPAASATVAMSEPLTIDYTYVGGRQPGKININTMWDPETFRALADAQLMNSFYSSNANHDLIVDNIFTRIVQQRQPQYYYTPRMVGQSGSNGTVPEDRPFQSVGTGDITASVGIPQQGIGNTFLTDRYQEQASGFTPSGNPRSNDMTSPVGSDSTDLHRFTRTLFEIGNPGMDHPQRRFELLSKIWNNMTVRSNTFSVWMTIGFFEYDDTNGLGAELGQIQGKNTRYRFFAVVDRTQIDSLLQSWALHDATAGLNTFMDTNRFPNLDPRYVTFPNMTAVSVAFGPIGPVPPALTGSSMLMPRPYQVAVATNPFITYDTLIPGGGGRLVYVESNAGSEVAQIISQTNTTINLQLTLNHAAAGGVMTIRPLPVPPTVLHWTQMK